MSTQLENPTYNDPFLQQNLSQYYRAILRNFRKIAHSFVLFNLLSVLLLLVELSLFFFFVPSLGKSVFFALALGGLFLTCFSYVILLFYFQAKKPEQLVNLKDQFIESCRKIITIPSGEAQHHLSLATALTKLANYLQDFEWNFYQSSWLFSSFPKLISRFSGYFHAEDVFTMKRLFLEAAIEEHLKQIRLTPTDLEVHASLAGMYVALSKIYLVPINEKATRFHFKNQELFEESFQEAAQLAIEEFKILSYYAPNDPWVHEQLAAGYRDLGMPEEEMQEMEILLKLRPYDKETLFRVGVLYFTQGLNAKGLQTYEELKKGNFKKAEDLIASYGMMTSKTQ